MENPEEILHCLEEFSKIRPKDIPRELEEYLCFVAKTGDPVYQWPSIKGLVREKMLKVITEFSETCPTVEIPPCPNVDLFNYDVTKNFILEKLDTFASAPFTVQRICELLTTPRKEYNRIDKYMRALEKNILVVSTTEPGGRRNTENGDGIVNGLESEHLPESSNSSNDINVEEMDDTPVWPKVLQNEPAYPTSELPSVTPTVMVQETLVTASKISEAACSSTQDTVITCRSSEETYVSIEPVPSNTCARQENVEESDVSVTITAIPAGVQKRRSSVEPVVSSESELVSDITESCAVEKSEVPQEEPAKPEDAETSLTQEVKDADSSSNPEEEEEEAKEEKVGVTPVMDFDENASLPGLSSTAETTVMEAEARVEDAIVETTKCSESPPEEEVKDSEITSSDKVVSTAESSSDLTRAEDNNSNEAASVNSEDTAANTESQEAIEKDEVSSGESTPMEVDESDKVEEVVKAEATSDSPL